MSKLSDKHCEVCLQKGIRNKVRTLCDKCREFLCKECSDAHLLFKAFRDHTLIDLDPSREESRSADKDKLASDFLEHATVEETSILYRAQVAVESGSQEKRNADKEMEAKTKQEKVDPSELKPKKITQFSVKRSDDKAGIDVKGILALYDKVIIVDNDNRKLKLYDSSGRYLSSTDLKEYTWGITRVNNDRFATCGGSNKVFLWTVRTVRLQKLLLWTVRGQRIISEDEVGDMDYYWSDDIHYNDTYNCVLHQDHNAVTILDRRGSQVRKIVMKEAFGKELTFGFAIHMDRDTHDIYVPCMYPNRGVLCMSVEGNALWFTPLSDSVLQGITEIHGALCVADDEEHKPCLHLISKRGQYIGKLLDKEKLAGQPDYIYYDEQERKLYIGYCSTTNERDIISVYYV